MNEAETRAEHIDPALREAGWGMVEGSRVQREFQITHGRIQDAGKRDKAGIADYVQLYRQEKILAPASRIRQRLQAIANAVNQTICRASLTEPTLKPIAGSGIFGPCACLQAKHGAEAYVMSIGYNSRWVPRRTITWRITR